MQPDAFPPDLAAFITAQPRAMGYSQLAEACRARFGATAPDAEAIVETALIVDAAEAGACEQHAVGMTEAGDRG